METRELEVIVERSGVEKTEAQRVLESFTEFFAQAAEWETKTKELVITDISQTEEMALARKGRLELKEIRVNAEKTKKKLKENILVKGRFIDSIYNLIEGVTKPLEASLLEKEKFAERKEEERLAAIRDERMVRLAAFDVDTTFIDFMSMPNDTFEKLVNSSREAFDAKVKAEQKAKEEAEAAVRKAEEDRIARERLEAAERARIEEENNRLKLEREEREKALEEERKKNEADRLAAEAAQKIKDEAARVEKEKQDALLKKAQDDAETARKELAEKEAAEAKKKKEIEAAEEAQRVDREKAERELARAGDRTKILHYISLLEGVSIPAVSGLQAKGLIDTLILAISSAKQEGAKL